MKKLNNYIMKNENNLKYIQILKPINFNTIKYIVFKIPAKTNVIKHAQKINTPVIIDIDSTKEILKFETTEEQTYQEIQNYFENKKYPVIFEKTITKPLPYPPIIY